MKHLENNFRLKNFQERTAASVHDAIAALLKEEAVLAYPFKGTRYDCGSKLGYLQATVALARKHPEVGAAFTAWMDAQEVSREEISREADAA